MYSINNIVSSFLHISRKLKLIENYMWRKKLLKKMIFLQYILFKYLLFRLKTDLIERYYKTFLILLIFSDDLKRCNIFLRLQKIYNKKIIKKIMINCKNKNTWLYYYNILYYIINIIYYIIKYIIILFFKRYQKIRKILRIHNQNIF